MDGRCSRSQGLEGTSVSIGCGRECTRRYICLGEIGIEGSKRKRHCLERPPEDVGENVLVSVGLRCGTMMVSRMRRNSYQYRM